MAFLLYHLVNPKNNQPFYIGITSQPLNIRLNKHCNKTQWKMNPIKARYIQSIRKQTGLKPIIQPIFENLSKEEARELEIESILAYRSMGVWLTNISDGGYLPSEEQKKKQSEKMKGHQVSKETRNKISLAHKGKKLSENHKQKISDSLKGNTYSLGHKHSDQTKNKMSKSHTGKPGPNKGKTLSEEHKKKIGLAGIGRKHSEETKKKMSNAAKKRNK
jgi:hypothetical protein